MECKAVIDRFEGSKAVLLVGEAEKEIVWPQDQLPESAQEGDVLQLAIEIDIAATAAAKAEAQKLLQELLEANKNR